MADNTPLKTGMPELVYAYNERDYNGNYRMKFGACAPSYLDDDPALPWAKDVTPYVRVDRTMVPVATFRVAIDCLKPLADLDLEPDDLVRCHDDRVVYARNKTQITVGDVRRAQAAIAALQRMIEEDRSHG